jgi:hypothetical protein
VCTSPKAAFNGRLFESPSTARAVKAPRLRSTDCHSAGLNYGTPAKDEIAVPRGAQALRVLVERETPIPDVEHKSGSDAVGQPDPPWRARRDPVTGEQPPVDHCGRYLQRSGQYVVDQWSGAAINHLLAAFGTRASGFKELLTQLLDLRTIGGVEDIEGVSGGAASVEAPAKCASGWFDAEGSKIVVGHMAYLVR